MKRVNLTIFIFLTLMLLPQLCWAAPVINSISPTNHNPGSFSVVISGSGFTGASWVRVYNASGVQVASPGFTINSASQITANANLQAGSYRFRVRTSAGTSNYSPTLTVSSAPPVISTISPTTGYTGALTIGIGGNNFTNVSGVSVYNTAGGTRSSRAVNASYTVNSNSQITATAQLKAGSYYFRVKTSAGSSNNSPALTVTNSLPVISGISPTTNVAGAMSVQISGSNFANIQAVKVYDAVSGSSTSNANYVASSTSQINASVNLAAGSFYFRVTTSAGTSNNSPTLTVTSTSPPPPPPPPGATSYKLKSPLPAIVNAGTVAEGVGTSSDRCIFKDKNGQFHLLAAFGGDNGWYATCVNLSTGASKFLKGTDTGTASMYAYNPTYNKLYGSTGYTQSWTSFYEYDPVTQSLNILKNQNLNAAIGGAVIGGDSRVYQYQMGNTLFSYDPAVGMPNGWKEYGTVGGESTTQQYRALGVDSGYVYCGIRRSVGTWALYSTPISGTPNWKAAWSFNNAGDTQVTISQKQTTHEWFATRTLSNGSTKVYWLANGTATDSGSSFVQDEDRYLISPFCDFGGDQSSYDRMKRWFGWELDFAELFPFKGVHEYSAVKYRQVWIGSSNNPVNPLPNFTTVSVNYNGPWFPEQVICSMPKTDGTVLSLAAGYNAAASLGLASHYAPTYLGANCFSPYEGVRLPNGEIYVAGYANKVYRYDPFKPWTLNSANSSVRLPSDATKPNPYFIDMSPSDIYDYRHQLDYDANGLVWIGGNTTRMNPNFGNVMWYKPQDGSHGYMFPGWKAAGTYFANLSAADNRSRICASDNFGKIWIIDTATKAVDPTPIALSSGSKTYMVEYANDSVFGITFLADGTYQVIKFHPSTKAVFYQQALPVTGTPFGFGDNQYERMSYKLELGPDGYIWMFVGNALYRVDPATSIFTKITDTTHGKVKFAPNNVDLLLYMIDGTTDFKYIPGLLQAVSP